MHRATQGLHFGLLSRLERFIASLPKPFRGERATFFFLYSCMVIVNALELSLIAPYPEGFPSSVLCAAGLFAAIVMRWYGASLLVVNSVGTSVGYVYLIYSALYTGGIHSPMLAWFLVIPLTPLYVVGRLAAAIWLVLVAMAYGGLAYLTNSGALPGDFTFDKSKLFWAYLIYVHVGIALTILPLLYDWQHSRMLDNMRERTSELENTRDELLAAQRHKDEFIASVSHELRTPMNAILGFNDILRQELVEAPHAREVVDHIRHSADHLLTVINDILDYSQLQAGKLTIASEPFALRQTINTVFELLRPKAEEQGLRYHLEIGPEVPVWALGDRQRLNQILVNLLGNALKFTHEGQVTIRVRADDDSVLQVEIEDTGIGIPADKLRNIFTRFEQGGLDINRRYGGTGLGLSICERLVGLQGGQISVSSIPQKGSVFRFTLPMPPSDDPRQGTFDQPSGLTADTSYLLIVDDNRVNRMVARRILQNTWPQAHIDEAGNGFEALEYLRNHRVDLVLMDMIMPELDGIEATRQLRRDFPEPVRSLPVIALTANVSPVDRERCLAAGMNDVVHKPFDKQELADRITYWLQRQRC